MSDGRTSTPDTLLFSLWDQQLCLSSSLPSDMHTVPTPASWALLRTIIPAEIVKSSQLKISILFLTKRVGKWIHLILPGPVNTVENHLSFGNALFILTREIPESDKVKTSKTMINNTSLKPHAYKCTNSVKSKSQYQTVYVIDYSLLGWIIFIGFHISFYFIQETQKAIDKSNL